MSTTATAWRDHAICAQTDPEVFFPEMGGTSSGSVREAKRVCRNCPVTRECLAFALSNHETRGVWGGMSAQERRRIR